MDDSESVLPPLLKMPEDVLRMIFENVDYSGISNLRKTCHDLRNFIDDVNPDLNAVRLWICVTSARINWRTEFSSPEDLLQLVYVNEDNECRVINTLRNRAKLFESRSYIDAFIDDFSIFMKLTGSQKVPIELVEFETETELFPQIGRKRLPEFYAKIEKLDSSLKVEKLRATLLDETEACAFLKLTSPGSLKSFEIESSLANPDKRLVLQTAKLPSMEQWKQLENVNIRRFDVLSPRGFLHLRNAQIDLINLSMEDAVLMKETFLKSPNFESFILRYATLDLEMFDAIGSNPLIDEVDEDDKYGVFVPKRTWCFRNSQNTKKALLIDLRESNELMRCFSINVADVPEDVEIRG